MRHSSTESPSPSARFPRRRASARNSLLQSSRKRGCCEECVALWRLNRTVAEYTEYCDLGDPLLAVDLYEVDQDLDDFESELEEKAIDVGSVLAGAAAGAAVGSAFPGLGNLVGGIIGGGVVLVAGWFEQWLNTDDGLGRTFTSSDPIQIQTELYLEDGENGFALDGKSDSRSILGFTKNVISGSCD